MKKYRLVLSGVAALCLFQVAIATADEKLAKHIAALDPEDFSGQIVIGDAEGILFSEFNSGHP